VWIKGLLLKLEKNGIGDNLLIWLKSYLSNRTQRVALSNIGQRKAGVPQGSLLDPLFLVFINDIADGMTGLGRLFADDTSIGYIANDKPDSCLSICLVHLQSLLKITPKCLCNSTSLNEVPSNSKLK
jgi:hypothetical protein